MICACCIHLQSRCHGKSRGVLILEFSLSAVSEVIPKDNYASDPSSDEHKFRMATESLIGHVQALPSELFNKIYDYTFTSCTNVVDIDHTYKPPSCLQVDTASRSEFIASYYGSDTAFRVNEKHAKIETFARWFKSLCTEAKECLSDVRLLEETFIEERRLES